MDGRGSVFDCVGFSLECFVLDLDLGVFHLHVCGVEEFSFDVFPVELKNWCIVPQTGVVQIFWSVFFAGFCVVHYAKQWLLYAACNHHGGD